MVDTRGKIKLFIDREILLFLSSQNDNIFIIFVPFSVRVSIHVDTILVSNTHFLSVILPKTISTLFENEQQHDTLNVGGSLFISVTFTGMP